MPNEVDYNDGNMHNWDGGECPVHPKSVIEYVWKHGGRGGTKVRIAGMDNMETSPAWKSRVVAFRVLEEYKPKVYWLVRDDADANDVWMMLDDAPICSWDCVKKVREV